MSAFAIAEWFRRRYNNPHAPLGTVWMLLSPSHAEISASSELRGASAKIRRSSTNNAMLALAAWKEECAKHPDNIAVLYAAGHGIALTPIDSFVLLEDYTEQNQPLLGSLDIGRIKNGMIGPSMARMQLYFADACRVEPEEAKNWEELGRGLAVAGRKEGPDRRSLAMFYSSTPYSVALSRRRSPTLFAQALLDALNGLAWVGPTETESYWHVDSDSLGSKLKSRIDALSKGVQMIEQINQGNPIVLHVIDPTPKVDLTVHCCPEPVVTRTWLNLRTGNGRELVRNRAVFSEHPFAIEGLNPGLYTMDVGFDPPVEAPFEPRTSIVVDACPPTRDYRLDFS